MVARHVTKLNNLILGELPNITVIKNEPYEPDSIPDKQQLSCIDILEHIKSCPVCSSIYTRGNDYQSHQQDHSNHHSRNDHQSHQHDHSNHHSRNDHQSHQHDHVYKPSYRENYNNATDDDKWKKICVLLASVIILLFILLMKGLLK